MGLLVEGIWQDKWYETKASGGRFERQASQFRHQIESEDNPDAHFIAEPDRYHLFVSYACPWAHRTLIFRKLKGLEDIIPFSVVSAYMGEQGWEFGDTAESLYCYEYLHQIYTFAKSNYSGRVTVPVLWDKKERTIVNNESSDIIRIFNSAFNGVGANDADFYPEALRSEIDETNDLIYPAINNGVYRCGFATTQEAYDEAFENLFTALDELEARLGSSRYLVGDQLTEADWRLFTTLLRFDPVYVGHFKCNKKRIQDYSNLWNYTLELAQYPGIASTIRMDHIKEHYYRSHPTINPSRIVPQGPEFDLSTPHHRS